MAILKRIRLGVGLFFTLGVSLCKGTEQVALDHFGYLNSNEAPAIIDIAEAQDLLNIEVTSGGKSIKKRSGYGSYKTLAGSQAIHGGHHFFDTSGNDVQVWGSSTSLFGIVADAAATTLVSSATLNATWDCADSQGSAYCVNTSRNGLIKTNGATMTWYAAPLGTMVAITPERLLVAGIAAAPNSIYYSAGSDFTNFTVGVNPPDSSIEPIASPGSRLMHIEYGCGRWLWWKDQSFGYVLGTDQTNLKIVTVSSLIGTRDNSSAIDPNGNVYFRGQDGHIYRYDCTNLTKLTQDIAPSIQTSGSRISNAWLVSSLADFNLGTTSNTTVGSAGVAISTTNTNFTDNSFEQAGTGGWTRSIPGGTFDNSSVGFIVGDNCGTINAKDGSKLRRASATGAFTVTFALVDSISGTSYGSTSVVFASNSCTWTQRTITPSVAAKTSVKIHMTCSSSSDYLDSVNFAYSGTPVTFWTASDTISSGVSTIVGFDFFQNGVTTNTAGAYYSSVHNAPNITSWSTLNIDSVDGSGTNTFYLRSSTISFTVLQSTPSWTTQISGQVISISTGTYFQFRDDFAVAYASYTPILQDFSLNWFEGIASDKAYTTYFDNAIWWALAYGSGQTTNNYVFKFDLINPGWTLFDIGIGGFLTQNNALYFGSSSTGALYRYGNSTSDNGTAISAYWKSKDFPGSDPWIENSYNQLDIVAQRNVSQLLTVGYTLNASTTTTSYTVSLSSSTDDTIRNKKLLPAGKIGGLINVKFSDSSASSAWEVLGFRIKYEPLPYRPTQ